MKALITGILGQDGAYLAAYLLKLGYEVVGGMRRSSSGSTWRLDRLGITSKVRLIHMEMLESSNLERILRTERPDEVYNLAAQSFVGSSFDTPLYTFDTNAMGTIRLLDALPEGTRFYQASTSEMFGGMSPVAYDEESPFYPRSPYGVAKLAAHWATINAREARGLFACCGILFNHESPLRGEDFVTRKVARTLARIAKGQDTTLVLGNLDASRDWGHARDYVEGMHAMMVSNLPTEYVLATGEAWSVRSFVHAAATAAGLRLHWEGDVAFDDRSKIRVKTSTDLHRPAEVHTLLGNPEKAYVMLGWKPKTSFEQLVTEMVEAELQ